MMTLAIMHRATLTAYRAVGRASCWSWGSPIASVVNGMNTTSPITTMLAVIVGTSSAANRPIMWWLLRQNTAMTMKLMPTDSSSPPLLLMSAYGLSHVAVPVTSIVVTRRVRENP